MYAMNCMYWILKESAIKISAQQHYLEERRKFKLVARTLLPSTWAIRCTEALEIDFMYVESSLCQCKLTPLIY